MMQAPPLYYNHNLVLSLKHHVRKAFICSPLLAELELAGEETFPEPLSRTSSLIFACKVSVHILFIYFTFICGKCLFCCIRGSLVN